MNDAFTQAYVLHSKPYRESSALVDFFTPQGRVRAVLRKARSRVGSIARPFMPLTISLVGKGELKTIKHIEATDNPYLFSGRCLFSGLYINELLVRLLPLEDACPALFASYQQALQQLTSQIIIEPLLRGFEWQLLNELGYSFSLVTTGEGEPIEPEHYYIFNPEYGLQRVPQFQAGAFYGRDLLAMSEADWSTGAAMASAKRLMRQVLAVHLQGKPLISRQLFS